MRAFSYWDLRPVAACFASICCPARNGSIPIPGTFSALTSMFLRVGIWLTSPALMRTPYF